MKLNDQTRIDHIPQTRAKWMLLARGFCPERFSQRYSGRKFPALFAIQDEGLVNSLVRIIVFFLISTYPPHHKLYLLWNLIYLVEKLF